MLPQIPDPETVLVKIRDRFKERDGSPSRDDPEGNVYNASILDTIKTFSLAGNDGNGMTRLPDLDGKEDYSKWQEELRRMSPEIEETPTSIWRIARITNETEFRQARFESEMCWDELFAPCHQRTRQKRFIARRIMLAEDALTTWANDGTWRMPEDIWEKMHLFDPDFQNAIMDLRAVYNRQTAQRAYELLEQAEHEMEVINESIARDKERHQFRDYSQVIDALINADPEDGKQVLNIIKNNNAYW